MLIANNLTKIYGRFIAAENVSFKVGKGEVACFLGPNGAGKSTTMKMLVGFLAPTSGSASIAGYDMTKERINGSRSLGYLPENGPLYPDMTPESLLAFFAELRRIGAFHAVTVNASAWLKRSFMIRTSSSWTSRRRASILIRSSTFVTPLNVLVAPKRCSFPHIFFKRFARSQRALSSFQTVESLLTAPSTNSAKQQTTLIKDSRKSQVGE